MSKTPPCQGHPCDCTQCVFAITPTQAPNNPTEVVSEENYGCVHGGSVVTSEDGPGLLREEDFHPLTPEGIAFLQETKNPLLAQLC